MAFLGTLINFFGVLLCGTLGALLKKGIPKRISEAIISAMAICVIYIGVDGALEAAPAVPAGSPSSEQPMMPPEVPVTKANTICPPLSYLSF